MDREEIHEIAQSAASKVTENQENCVYCGMTLIREHSSFMKATPIIFPSNLRGLVYGDDLKVANSELAMATGAAGKEIIAFALTGERSGILIFDDSKGGCEYTFGLETELFRPALLKKVNEMWEKRGPD